MSERKSKHEAPMPTMDEFRDGIAEIMRKAKLAGDAYVEINSGELHRKIGGYPGRQHRMPACCDAMFEAQRAGDELVSAPPKGKGASLTIRYKLPR